MEIQEIDFRTSKINDRTEGRENFGKFGSFEIGDEDDNERASVH